MADGGISAFRGIGVDVRTDNAVTRIERTGEEFRVQTRTPQGTAAIPADLAVHAARRVPDIVELKLTAGTVEVENRRLRLNEYPQSVSNAIVYMVPMKSPCHAL